MPELPSAQLDVGHSTNLRVGASEERRRLLKRAVRVPNDPVAETSTTAINFHGDQRLVLDDLISSQPDAISRRLAWFRYS